jgi:hypothetical protein
LAPDISATRVYGIPTEPVILALVIAVVGAVVLPFIKLSTYFPGQSKWVYGGIWFVAGIVILMVGYKIDGKGLWRSIVLGASIGFFIAAFLQWAGWSYSK